MLPLLYVASRDLNVSCWSKSRCSGEKCKTAGSAPTSTRLIARVTSRFPLRRVLSYLSVNVSMETACSGQLVCYYWLAVYPFSALQLIYSIKFYIFTVNNNDQMVKYDIFNYNPRANSTTACFVSLPSAITYTNNKFKFINSFITE